MADIIPAEGVRDAINLNAARGVPFLFAVDFELTEGIFIADPLLQRDVLFATPLGGNSNASTWPAGDQIEEKNDKNATPLTIFAENYESYLHRYSIVRGGLLDGDSFLANLTLKTPIDTQYSPQEIFYRSRAPYRFCIPGRLVCFSPERFIRIENGRISTNPMKGTIDASLPEAEKIILSDPKETAEHNTIVDLLRNDLGMVARDICVDRYRYTERISTNAGELIQVSSEISGQLPGQYLTMLGDIIWKMLPAGSVSGAPKKSTLEIIRRAEKTKRGFYTGCFGYFDGRILDTGVMIRYIEKEGDRMFFRSGGGVTVYSAPEKEYNEVIQKIYLPFQ